MIEKIILDYLQEALSVPVYMEQPIQKPESYVLLEKTGSARDDFISTATVAIQSYAKSLHEAAKLNEVVKEKMDNIVTLDAVMGARLNTDYNFTDTEAKRYRYQAVYDLFY